LSYRLELINYVTSEFRANALIPGQGVFLEEFGRRIKVVTRDSRSMSFLCQRLSVAVQKGNAACVLGTEHWDAEETVGCL